MTVGGGDVGGGEVGVRSGVRVGRGLVGSGSAVCVGSRVGSRVAWGVSVGDTGVAVNPWVGGLTGVDVGNIVGVCGGRVGSDVWVGTSVLVGSGVRGGEVGCAVRVGRGALVNVGLRRVLVA